MARREVWNQVGPLDETIFGFGEDIEWCMRAKGAGWEVWYYPGSVITHLKGQGGAHIKPYHRVWGIHQAVWTIYRKHLRTRYYWPVTGVFWLGIRISLALSIITTWARVTTRQVFDRTARQRISGQPG